MNEAIFYMTLDIDDALSSVCMHLRQGESGRKISVKMTQSGKPYPIKEGYSAVFAGTRPDGQIFFNNCTVEGGHAVCDVSAQITSVPGAVRAEMRLYGEDDVLIASPAFEIDIAESTVDEGEIVDGPETTALTSLICQAQEAIEDCRATAVNKVEVRLLEEQGEPSAFVELDKSEDERIMRFTFSNLKGEKGETGPQGPKGDQGRDGTDLAAYATPTVSGAPASFDDGAEDLPVKSLTVDIEPAQAGSGEASPDNIRPISGWTAATVTRTGGTSAPLSYTIDFPAEAGTVYGGTLDVTNGVLTVDRAKIQLNSLSYTKEESSATNARFRSSIAGMKAPTDNYTTVNAICATYPAGPWSWIDEPGHNIFFAARQWANVMHFIVRNSAYATTAEFVASLSDADVLVYELATPVTYQLTPTEVKTLLGENNIHADTGVSTVQYRADPTLIYNKLTAAIISSGGTI